MTGYKVGDLVTFTGDQKGDPYILKFQYHAVVAEVVKSHGGTGYVIDLEDARPRLYGPFGEHRLLPGWRDEHGRPRVRQ